MRFDSGTLLGASQVAQRERIQVPMQEMWVGLVPRLRRFPGEGNGNPLQYSCLGNPMDRGAWRAHKSWQDLVTEQQQQPWLDGVIRELRGTLIKRHHHQALVHRASAGCWGHKNIQNKGLGFMVPTGQKLPERIKWQIQRTFISWKASWNEMEGLTVQATLRDSLTVDGEKRAT